MVKIAIVDDHALVRSGLASMISLYKDYSIILEAGNGKEFIDMLDVNDLPSIVILDIIMPEMDGYETAKWLYSHHPEIKVLALSMECEERSIIKILKHGAKGYIVKDSHPSELKQALDHLVKKGIYLNEFVCSNIIQSMNNQFNEDQERFKKRIEFSDREMEFIQLACSDVSYKQIAEAMFLSPRTIDGYRDSVYAKLKLSSRIGLVLYAIKKNLIDI